MCSRLPSPGNADPKWKEKHHLLTNLFSGASTLTLRELLAPRCSKGFNMQYMFIQQTVKTSWESTMKVCQLSNGGRILDIFQPSAFIIIYKTSGVPPVAPPDSRPYFVSHPTQLPTKKTPSIPTRSAVSPPSSHRSENKMHPRSHQTSLSLVPVGGDSSDAAGRCGCGWIAAGRCRGSDGSDGIPMVIGSMWVISPIPS